jgi:hypothetical protein
MLLVYLTDLLANEFPAKNLNILFYFITVMALSLSLLIVKFLRFEIKTFKIFVVKLSLLCSKKIQQKN